MTENTHGTAIGDLRMVETVSRPRKESNENAKTSARGKGIIFGHLFDGDAKGNFERPSIYRGTKVQHMAAEAAGLRSKEVDELQNHCALTNSSALSDKELDSSLASESGLEELVPTKSCACTFCTKAAFMWTDLHYQDARSRLSVLKKSIKRARLLEAKIRGNEYAANVARNDSGRAAEIEFELSQQKRSLFLYTENALVRESRQLHSAFVKLKELRENCKTDLERLATNHW